MSDVNEQVMFENWAYRHPTVRIAWRAWQERASRREAETKMNLAHALRHVEVLVERLEHYRHAILAAAATLEETPAR